MTRIFIDFETYSTVDLKKRGLHVYSRDPSTGIWCMAYAFDDGPVKVWTPPHPLPTDVLEHVRAGAEVVAHNAQFERELWNRVLVPGITPVKIQTEQLCCTMARAYAMALPGTLEGAALALGLRLTKDTEGRALMLRMCRPVRTENGRPVWLPELDSFTFMGEKVKGSWAVDRLADYCKTDVEVERELWRRTVKLSAVERRIWRVDQAINQRGIPFALNVVGRAVRLRDAEIENLDARMAAVTGGDVAKCSNVGALKEWAADHGVVQESLAKAELGELLLEELPAPVREALELRQEAGRATSVAKLDAVLRTAGEDGRVRFAYQYHGAATGRWAGRNIQPHNLTRDLPPPDVVEEVMTWIWTRDRDLLELVHGPVLTMLSKVMRGFIEASLGRRLVGGDWSNIEGRGLAWLAGEEWKLEAFRRFDAGAGPDIYRLAYHRAFRVPLDDVSSEQRQIGKVMELALGYGGGVGAFQSMARTYRVAVPDAVAEEAKHRWRKEHPRVKQFWRQLETAAINAVQYPDRIFNARQCVFRIAGSFLWCRLPSNRVLCYPYPELRDGKYGRQLTYKTVPSANDRQRGHIIDDPKNSSLWARVGTFGGKLAENVTQAICRDVLAGALVAIEDEGETVIMHTHDDILVETQGRSAAWLEEHMRRVPGWAAGFPLAAQCWEATRYRKG